MKKQHKLGYADVKMVFYRMHCAGCARRLSLCEYFDPYGQQGLYPHLNPPLLGHLEVVTFRGQKRPTLDLLVEAFFSELRLEPEVRITIETKQGSSLSSHLSLVTMSLYSAIKLMLLYILNLRLLGGFRDLPSPKNSCY